MSNFSGLQIDPRCIKCGRPPTAQAPLFEMRNHLYICTHCRQIEEQKGKQIAWKDGIEMTPSTQLTTHNVLVTQPVSHTTTIPKNSLFGVLGIPLTASPLEVETASTRERFSVSPEASRKSATAAVTRKRTDY